MSAATLHLLFCAPQHADTLADCCAAMQTNDVLLLLCDGVYAALQNSESSARLAGLPAGIQLRAIAEDCAARGITQRVDSRVGLIEYADFVQLSASCARSVSWF